MPHPVRNLAVLACVLAPLPAWAGSLSVEPVTEGVWAVVGPKEQRNPENLGNNATFGVVATDDGLVLIDPGGSWKGALAIDQAIDTVTDAPVRLVINTGGQDHRWLGNGYWRAQGAEIVASADAVADQKARGSMQLTMLSQLLGPELEGTEPVQADRTFADSLTLDHGGVTFELVDPGHAHTPGDAYVWVPQKDVMFTGDIVYVERILGVNDHSHAGDWITAFDAMAAHEPAHVVPGHGGPTDLDRARADTRDYLANLRQRMRDHIDSGGDIMTAPQVDQSAFEHLEQFDALAGRNAQQVFTEMEWE